MCLWGKPFLAKRKNISTSCIILNLPLLPNGDLNK